MITWSTQLEPSDPGLKRNLRRPYLHFHLFGHIMLLHFTELQIERRRGSFINAVTWPTAGLNSSFQHVRIHVIFGSMNYLSGHFVIYTHVSSDIKGWRLRFSCISGPTLLSGFCLTFQANMKSQSNRPMGQSEQQTSNMCFWWFSFTSLSWYVRWLRWRSSTWRVAGSVSVSVSLTKILNYWLVRTALCKAFSTSGWMRKSFYMLSPFTSIVTSKVGHFYFLNSKSKKVSRFKYSLTLRDHLLLSGNQFVCLCLCFLRNLETARNSEEAGFYRHTSTYICTGR